MSNQFSLTKTMLSLVGAICVIASGVVATSHVVSAVPTAIFSENFNSIVQGYTGSQVHTGLTVGAWDTLDGWTRSGDYAVHDVDRILGVEKDIAVTIYDNQITLTAGFAANASGVTYTMSFELGPSAWATASEATNATDGLLISLLRPDNTVLASSSQLAGAWNATAAAQDAMTSRSFSYVGDGSGVVRIKISNTQSGTGRFGGAIDNIVVVQGGTAGTPTTTTPPGGPTCSPTTSTVGTDTVAKFVSVGSCTWYVPSSATTARILLIAGGGGGGADNGGGGGGGGFVTDSSVSLTPGTLMTVVVGNGGAGSVNVARVASNGGNSSFAGLIALGGGGGGSIQHTAGADGGSAGGRSANYFQIAEDVIVTTSPLQGNNGGGKSASGYAGGGGGGAGGIGLNGGGSSSIGGNGGAGRTSNISGVDVEFGGGGGGGGNCSVAGSGGSGGGANGSSQGDQAPGQGVDGLGGGGGGGGGCTVAGTGAKGGSGIVIVRYAAAAAPTNLTRPDISGETQTGSRLTVTSGTWRGSPSSFAYQWKRAATSGGPYADITSATNDSYLLTDADIGKYIKVSVIATNDIDSSLEASSDATSIVVDLADSVVPTTTSPVATSTGFTFAISNYVSSFTYAVSTSNGSVSRWAGDVKVTGLDAGESATVTILMTKTNYKSASKTVTGTSISALAPTTTTTAKPSATTATTDAPSLSIVIQAPVSTVAKGQVSIETLAPTTTTIAVLATRGLPTPKTTNSTLPPMTATTVVPPEAAKVSAGQSAVQVDGVDTEATVSRENNQMIVNAGSVSATLSGLDKAGKTLPLDADGTVHLSAGDVIKVSVGGFEPESVVEVWLFSTPTQLGSAIVGTDGTMSGTYTLPIGIKSGSHRVAVTAKLSNGKSTTFTLGILVGDVSTTSTRTRVLIAIPITLAIGFGFLLPNQLRRRRKIRST